MQPRERDVGAGEVAPVAGENAPLAFVIMPFGLVFDQVYERLFVPVLVDAGYRVRRADTLLNQQAIMRDVIEGIVAADLIWADLSGGNPNVFYELGIAHALRRDTVLLAQRREDIPFDLRSYKNHVYRVEFAETPVLVDDVRAEMAPFLAAARREEVVFGSPFLDFAPGSAGPAEAPTEEDEMGILDTVLDLQSSVPDFTVALEEATALSETFTTEMTRLTEALQEVPEGTEPLAHAVAMGAEIGAMWDATADQMEQLNAEKLGPLTLRIERGVKATLDMQRLNPEGQTDETREALVNLRTMARQAAEAAETQTGLGVMTRENARYIGSLRRPGERLATSYDQFASSFGRIAALQSEIPEP